MHTSQSITPIPSASDEALAPSVDARVAGGGSEAEGIRLPDPPADMGALLAGGAAVAWSEPLEIRTYEAGEPSRFPMYMDHRVYQGSSGRIYPLPFVEQIADEPVRRQWQAVHLENEYLRLVILPELGGRIHIGYDKSTGYDFFYRNNVIKPALVGLGGPWISGGVEFNWPQHHRPATYLPVETTIEHEADGSVTVWCGDHDPFTRMAAQHGVRLRPGSSVVELRVRLHNRTSERQTFLWWANVAARVNDHYQSFFPEDVRYVADHARRALTAFPSADRTYYGVDYPDLAKTSPGADRIDFYRNIPVPTSYMIVDSEQDFFGGYDHAVGAGFIHWAERRVSPGKKQWTWGNAPFGHTWDAQLTDADGPYVELMAGVYTDNQPDFSWLLPGETKVFTQYWYPLPATGPAHQATPDAAVHVERADSITARFAVTALQPGAQLRICRDGEPIKLCTMDLRPGAVATLTAPVADGDLSAELLDRSGRLLVRWAPTVVSDEEPWVADEPPQPEDIGSVEELYLTGLHLAQYRHPTRSPLPYWEEALRRDHGDARTNLAFADREYRAGRYEKALAHIDTALQRLLRRNANPTDAEGFYLAGLVLARLGRLDEAERALGKAGWDGTWAPGAGLELARLHARRGRNRSALRVLDSLDGIVGHDTRRIALRAIVLRRIGRRQEADTLIRRALQADPLDVSLRVLADDRKPTDPGLLLDVAFEMRHAGELEAALALFAQVAVLPLSPAGNQRPVARYAAAATLDSLGRHSDAAAERAEARREELTWAFPCGLDAHDTLSDALDAEPGDAVAKFLLGMLHYHNGRRSEASQLWESAIELGLQHPVLLRNAGLAAYNIEGDDDKAWQRYSKAVALDSTDARLLYEQDQLAIRLDQLAEQRYARLAPKEDLVLSRDDLAIEYIGLLVANGRADRAYEILTSRQFHPWEGGEGRAVEAWDETLRALRLPLADPPLNLGEARAAYQTPAAIREDGATDYFATSLPELLIFAREIERTE